MAITKEYQNWPDKPWNATEEMWKRKAKSLEGQYQQLLSDHQEMRLEKAKLIGEVRVLRRYKEVGISPYVNLQAELWCRVPTMSFHGTFRHESK